MPSRRVAAVHASRLTAARLHGYLRGSSDVIGAPSQFRATCRGQPTEGHGAAVLLAADDDNVHRSEAVEAAEDASSPT
jgi:hypothetical protein